MGKEKKILKILYSVLLKSYSRSVSGSRIFFSKNRNQQWREMQENVNSSREEGAGKKTKQKGKDKKRKNDKKTKKTKQRNKRNRDKNKHKQEKQRKQES